MARSSRSSLIRCTRKTHQSTIPHASAGRRLGMTNRVEAIWPRQLRRDLVARGPVIARLFKLRLDDRPDAVGREFRHAVEPVAFLDEAGCTPDAALNGGDARAVRPGECGAGASINADHPRPAAAARWSGPVSLESTRFDSAASAASWGRVVPPQRSRMGIGPSSRISRSTSERSAAEPMAIKPTQLMKGTPANRGEMMRRPSLGFPPCPHVENDTRRSHPPQLVLRPPSIVVMNRHLELRFRCIRAKALATRRTRSTAWSPMPGRVDGVGIKPARSLASVGDPDPDPGPRRQCHQGGSQ